MPQLLVLPDPPGSGDTPPSWRGRSTTSVRRSRSVPGALTSIAIDIDCQFPQ
ncbi:MAG: hypothetical protein VX949_02255 [Planctomycetota bacterium]|nr:hypothetical protein [Planctomycetota bacterium]